jgi:hypothetical protein
LTPAPVFIESGPLWDSHRFDAKGLWISEQVRSEAGMTDRRRKGFLNGGALVRAVAEGIDTGAGGAQTRWDPWWDGDEVGLAPRGTVEV